MRTSCRLPGCAATVRRDKSQYDGAPVFGAMSDAQPDVDLIADRLARLQFLRTVSAPLEPASLSLPPMPQPADRDDATVPWSDPKTAGFTPVTSSIGGLLLGLALGVWAHEAPNALFSFLTPGLTAASTLWLNALTALVLPLTVANVIAAIIRSHDARTVGTFSAWALGMFVVMLLLGAAFTLAVVPPTLAFLPVDAAFARSLTQGLSEVAREAALKPPLAMDPSSIVTFFVPRNLLKSALNDELLPVLIFSIAFAFAVNRVQAPSRAVMDGFFRALAEVLFTLLKWILRVMPAGVFALAYTFSADAGLGVAGVLGQFVLLSCGAMFLFTVLLYPVTAVAGRISIGRFAAGVLPAQLSAIATRSSIASLPALLDGALRILRLDPVAANLSLPLSVAVFKVNRTVSSTVKALFLAHLFGIALGPVQIATFVFTIILLSFTSLGVPGGGAAFKSMAAYLAAGLPIEGIVLLEAVDVIADIFKTVLNVTGDMAVAVVVSRLAQRRMVASTLVPEASHIVLPVDA